MSETTTQISGGCPCLYVEPCRSSCTCASPTLSGGCSRCARYGSPSQRSAAAKRLAAERTELLALRRLHEAVRTLLTAEEAAIEALITSTRLDRDSSDVAVVRAPYDHTRDCQRAVTEAKREVRRVLAELDALPGIKDATKGSTT